MRHNQSNGPKRIAGRAPGKRARTFGGPVCIALVGQGLAQHSLAVLHAVEAQALGFDLQIDHLDPEAMVRARPSLAQMLDMLEIAGFAGANIASPYKRAALAHVDELSPSARATGAVTTILFRDGVRLGHNTTAWAFRESLRRSLGQRAPGDVLVLGAGPSGAAAAHALRDLGTGRLLIHDPVPDRAEALALDCNGIVADDPARVAEQVHGIVNACPVGGPKRPGLPIAAGALLDDHWVADMLEDPFDTALLQAARDRGSMVISGVGLAVFRLMRDFHLMTGMAPDVRRLRGQVEERRRAG